MKRQRQQGTPERGPAGCLLGARDYAEFPRLRQCIPPRPAHRTRTRHENGNEWPLPCPPCHTSCRHTTASHTATRPPRPLQGRKCVVTPRPSTRRPFLQDTPSVLTQVVQHSHLPGRWGLLLSPNLKSYKTKLWLLLARLLMSREMSKQMY